LSIGSTRFFGGEYLEKFENPAVVIGGGINGLGVIRNLGRNGVDVYCAIDEKDPAIYSKYCKGYFSLPGVENDLTKLKSFLTIFEHQITREAVVFPTSDISAINVSSVIPKMEKCVASISDKETLETLVKKTKFYHSLKTMGVPHPTTLFPSISENLKNIQETPFPVFVKPSLSQIFSQKFGKKGFIVNSKGELNRYLRLMDKYKIDVMVQEIVPGPATNHYLIDGYLDKNFTPVALFARRRLRMWPPSLGNSTICESVPISEVSDMKETLVEYLTSIGFRGIFNAEFKRDSRDNVCKLLEVNARSWWYNSFPSTCGVNIILMAYLEAIGRTLKPVRHYEVGTKLIYFMEDIKWALSMFYQRKFSFRQWLSPMIGKRDWAIFARDDVNPFIMSVLKTARIFMSLKNVRVGLKQGK